MGATFLWYINQVFVYSKNEASILRQEFWTNFGLYMKPVPTKDDSKVNWINYKTGLKHIRFTMAADQNKAMIAIEINHPDSHFQQLYTDQFILLKRYFKEIMEEDWQWNLHMPNDFGSFHTIICREIKDVNIFNKNDWPVLITFFKERIIKLHEFWCTARYSFEYN